MADQGRPVRSDLSPDLADIMDLEPLADDRFLAHHSKGNHVSAIFGGSLAAQAVRAAEITAPGRAPHAVHAHYHRAGTASAPVEHQVERIRDGGAFSSRRVSARQDGRLLFDATISLQAPAEGFAHQRDWREPPPPDAVPTRADLVEAWRDRLSRGEAETILSAGVGLELRIVDAEAFLRPNPQASGRFWARPVRTSDRSVASGYAALAFTSDFFLARATLMPHLRSAWDPDAWTISLDHALWLYAPSPEGEWLLFDIDSPWTGGGRGTTFGRIYSEAGQLVATVAQEALIRTARPR